MLEIKKNMPIRRTLTIFFILCGLLFLVKPSNAIYQSSTIGNRSGISGAAGSAITFVAQETVSEYSTNLSLATDNAINVNSGDTVVVWIGTQVAAVQPTAFTDSQTNTYTIRTTLNQSSATGTMAYVINATGSATMTFTATFGDATLTRKTLIVMVFSPGSGESITLDIAVNGGAYSASPWQTGINNTTGTDEICYAGFQTIGGTYTYSNQEIPSATAATVLTSGDAETTAFYRILTGTVASILAETDVSASQYFIGEMLCFKSQ